MEMIIEGYVTGKVIGHASRNLTKSEYEEELRKKKENPDYQMRMFVDEEVLECIFVK